MLTIDGAFEIQIEEQNVFIVLTPPKEGGKALDITEIVEALEQQEIKDFDLVEVLQDLENLQESKRYQIKGDPVVKDTLPESNISEAPKKDEKFFNLSVSDDRMKLYIIFYPASHDKTEDELYQEIHEYTKKLKIVAPIQEEVLKALLKDIQYNTAFDIGMGVPVEESTETTINYHFKTEKNYSPEVDNDGNVDYHKLDIFSNVTKGQKLATLIPGYEGKSGTDLFGMEVKPKKQKPVKLKRGKNVGINLEGTELFAELSGHVVLEDDKVVVHDILEVENVGNATGDVDFQGSVVVNGNVITGFKVIAKGDVEISGVVEGAIIEAGGNVILHRGIQGMNSSKIVAGGNVMAKYIENTEIVSGGIIHSEAILHSNVSARGEIIVEGKKGMITGGTVRSGIEVSANILGSHMGTATNIEVGIDPLVWEEYNSLLKELPKLKLDAEKLEQVITLINKRKEIEGELDEQKKTMYLSATRNKIILTNKINIAERRIEELKSEVETRNDGRIKVRGSVYPGVRITIGTAKYFVRDELKYVCMIKEGADVKLTSL